MLLAQAGFQTRPPSGRVAAISLLSHPDSKQHILPVYTCTECRRSAAPQPHLTSRTLAAMHGCCLKTTRRYRRSTRCDRSSRCDCLSLGALHLLFSPDYTAPVIRRSLHHTGTAIFMPWGREVPRAFPTLAISPKYGSREIPLEGPK